MSLRSHTFCACLLALASAGCAGRQDPPPRRVHGTDVRLAAEIQTIEAKVPAHATLDQLLRHNQLQDRFVTAAVDATRAVLRRDQPAC